MRRSTTDKTSRQQKMVVSLPRVAWLSLMMTCASKAAAFQSSGREPATILHRQVVRDTSTDSYDRQRRSINNASTSTRLQYRDRNEEHSSLKQSSTNSKWWSTLFDSESISDQDSVDEYLEFLDRRYNRLHEEKEEKPFSAINWLLQGQPKEGEILASKQQKEDALYVLGVAGLASQKLLQKRPQKSSEEEDQTVRTANPKSLEALDTIAVSADDSIIAHAFVKRVLVPIVKVLYILHHRKQVFLNVQTRRAKQFAALAARSTLRSLLYGPMKAVKAILKVSGGTSNVASTLAFASTLVILFRPFAEGLITEVH